MNKVDIITQITENTELMQAIERLVDVVDNTHDEFVQERMAEWHELRKQNGYLVDMYNRKGKVEEVEPVSFDELNLVLHSIKEKVEKGGLL